jgi:uncharacterized cofD-like protein
MAGLQIDLVAIGGGLGAVQILRGMKQYTTKLTGIIAVTDTGRSTGIVRDFAQMPAPGDIRNALVALADENKLLAKIMQHRFEAPGYDNLDGMAFGNLMIAALTQMSGSFTEAVETMHKLMNVSSNILPVSTESTHICAELIDGTIVEKEFDVRGLNKAAIKRVYLLDRDVKANPACVDAIKNADLITLGPGSLFTSTIACLCFDEVAQAIRESDALTVYMCNNTTQPGQTDNYTIADHVQQITHYLGDGVLDYAFINSAVPPQHIIDNYAKNNLHVLRLSDDQLARVEALGVKPVVGEIADASSGPRDLWQKQDTIRHDPDRVAELLVETYNQRLATTE